MKEVTILVWFGPHTALSRTCYLKPSHPYKSSLIRMCFDTISISWSRRKRISFAVPLLLNNVNLVESQTKPRLHQNGQFLQHLNKTDHLRNSDVDKAVQYKCVLRCLTGPIFYHVDCDKQLESDPSCHVWPGYPKGKSLDKRFQSLCN